MVRRGGFRQAAFGLLLFLMLFTAGIARGGVDLFPPPPGIVASTQYEVSVLIDGQWKPSYVNLNLARTAGSGSDESKGRKFSWTTFRTTEPVKVRVKRLVGEAFKQVVIRPQRFGIEAARVDSHTVEFTIAPGQKLAVDFDTAITENCFTGPPYGIACVTDALMIFADKAGDDALAGMVEADVYRVAPGDHQSLVDVKGLPNGKAGRCTLGDCGGRKVVVFPPGVYDIGYWQVPASIEQIHIGAGAVVYGALDVLPLGVEPHQIDYRRVYRDDWHKQTLRPAFRLSGHGILSGQKLPWHLKKDFGYSANDDWWEHVKLVQLAAEKIDVRDVTLVDSPYWVLSFINDADTRVSGVCDNFKIVGAWNYNNDGLPIPAGKNSRISNAFVHADDDAFKIYSSGGTIENCVVWQANNGAVFQFGWFAKSVSDVSIRQVDVVHFENWYGVHQSNRAVFNYANAGGPGVIEKITFDDVTVEGKVLRLFGLRPMGKQVIRDFTFNRLNCGGMGIGQIGPPGRNYFLGNISGFRFVDFTFDGNPVTTAEQAQFDFGEGAGEGFTFSASE